MSPPSPPAWRTRRRSARRAWLARTGLCSGGTFARMRCAAVEANEAKNREIVLIRSRIPSEQRLRWPTQMSALHLTSIRGGKNKSPAPYRPRAPNLVPSLPRTPAQLFAASARRQGGDGRRAAAALCGSGAALPLRSAHRERAGLYAGEGKEGWEEGGITEKRESLQPTRIRTDKINFHPCADELTRSFRTTRIE